MKKILIYIVVVIAVISCEKNSAVDLESFNVVMTKAPVKVGDTAFFSIQGNPDFISFYSGERGRIYDYNDRIVAESSIPQLTFTSFGQGLASQFPKSLSLLISSNYKGDTNAINSATWNDITNRAVLSTGTTGTSSGTIDLSDFRTFDSVYLGFKYKVPINSTLAQPTWTIQSFNINNISLPDSTVYNVRAIGTLGWQIKDMENQANTWQVSSTQLKITGGAANSSANEDWVIAKVSLKSVTPDLGVPIKNISERVNSYFYKFNKAGIFKVTFLAGAKRVDENNTVVKQFDISVN